MDKSPASLWEAIMQLAPLVGAGGISAMVVAYFGTKKAKPDEQPSSPIEVESPWFVQNLLEIKLNIEALHKKFDDRHFTSEERYNTIVQRVEELTNHVEKMTSALISRNLRD